MKLIPVIVVCLLCCMVQTVQADELWRELLPDNGAVLLGVNKDLDGQVIPAGSWDAFVLSSRPVEADVWSVSPLGIGASWGILGSTDRPRYLGIGYDGKLPGERWHDRLLIYAKTQVVVEF